jgi:hypothetical protein
MLGVQSSIELLTGRTGIMDCSVVPDGVSFSPQKLGELEQLLRACWEEVISTRPDLVDTENESSLRNGIASRLIKAAATGEVDSEELRRRALEDIL